MQYALLIYENEQVYGADKTGPAMQDIIARHMTFSQHVGAARIGGAGLRGTRSATTLRTANGTTSLHDGPFAETKEQLGGFYLIDVADLDAAIAIARKLPLAADGAVEIRPLLGPG